ncbi:hypothetical protein FCR2A7T_02660 [Flavobacterium cauense R2A-7]|uniref:Uncharacterized protein n=1 Tax=Flavobacterium cauense R2A-7 TaxID=1341154 RepID=V6S554_9FLAO|nr:hypothetical protein [Flavobacterium cauense]ESU21808.1 hypothetical protein FCR2A7T_02660 [Flavobacterium cauense R2A-7]KGO81040.1 hypothetical protein Q762_10395 [Flavobacterium cauense R2A-7]TWI12955.1 hypothetical protein IP98_01434 [Flavobacterium cauense R2A-7]
MKKKLEAELISIAHRILKLKNKEDVIQLHQEAQKLYEKLSILRFYEENFEALKPTLTHEELDAKIEQAYGEKEEVTAEIKAAVKPVAVVVSEIAEEIPVADEKILVGQVDVAEEEVEEEEAVVLAEEELIVEEEAAEIAPEEPVAETPEEEVVVAPLFEPVMEEAVTPIKEEKKPETQQISFEDLLGNAYKEPEFVKVNDVPKEVEKVAEITFDKVAEVVEEPVKEEVLEEKASNARPLETIRKEIEAEKAEYKALSLNDKFNKTITLGLNDRITFEKYLFDGSGEDLNRVLSQLNSFNTLEEAKNFIEDLVKPDYNNWDGKDEFSSRFMELVEKKFA